MSAWRGAYQRLSCSQARRKVRVGKEVVAVPVVAEATWFAQQAVDDMAVIDVTIRLTDQTGQPFDQFRAQVDLKVPFANPDIDPATDETGRHRIMLARPRE